MSGRECRFLWHELLTTDVEAARGFYTDVVGWETEAWSGAAGPYTLWLAGGTAVGGLMALPDEARRRGAPPHWAGYVGVDDVDAATGRARDLGAATLVPPTDIPEVGRFAVIKDPQGAVLTLFRPNDPEAMPSPSDPRPQPGRFAWNELSTTDPEAAWDFHRRMFGWTQTDALDLGALGTYRLFGAGGPALGGMMGCPSGEGSGWLYYVTVADLDQALARVAAGGGRVENGPMDVPGGARVAHCTDPQGVWFGLHAVGA